MNFGVCCVPVAPIRIEANHKSEMISQLLFGEFCTIQEIDKNGWVNIICKADGYRGWCQLAHIKDIDAVKYNTVKNNVADGWSNVIKYDGALMTIPMGCLIDTEHIYYDPSVKLWQPENAIHNAATIKSIAVAFLNTAYLWGGRSVYGIDCSGFAQAVYKFLNISLLRDAHLQATQGEIVNFLQEAQCGDLAFFDDVDGKIVHVGILLSSQEIIHASGKVRIDKIDNQGIVNTETGLRTHQLRIIKRYFQQC